MFYRHPTSNHTTFLPKPTPDVDVVGTSQEYTVHTRTDQTPSDRPTRHRGSDLDGFDRSSPPEGHLVTDLDVGDPVCEDRGPVSEWYRGVKESTEPGDNVLRYVVHRAPVVFK